jgi:hypothetical protein
MLARWFPWLAAWCVVTAASPVRGAEAEKVQPAALVRVRSLDTVLADGMFLAALGGEKAEEFAKQIHGIIKGRTSDKGLEGIDLKRPLGWYTYEPLGEIPGVVMIPIADEETFVNLLKGHNLEVKKGKEGIYTVPINFLRREFQAYFRFANKYAYITALNSGLLDDKKLLDPEALKLRSPKAVAGASLFIDRISETSKKLAISVLEVQAKELQKRKPPRETEADEKIRVRFLKDLAANIAQVIKEGNELGLVFEVDREAQNLALTLSLTGLADSKLKENIAVLGQSPSLFAGLTKADAAASLLVHVALPEKMRKVLEPRIDERLKEFVEKEKDETKRELVDKFIRAITPTLKGGELDTLLSLRGPSTAGHYSVLAALKVKKGEEIAKIVRDVITQVAPQTEKAKIKFDADKVGEVAIHRVTLEKEVDKKFKKAFGDDPVYFAFRDDALIITLGEGSQAAIKEAVAAKAKAGPLVQVDLAVGRLVPLLAASKRFAPAAQAAKEVFDEDAKDPGKVRITLAGGKSFTARLSVTASVIKFGIQAAKEARKRAQEEEEKAAAEAEKARAAAEKARADAEKKRKEKEKKEKDKEKDKE